MLNKYIMKAYNGCPRATRSGHTRKVLGTTSLPHRHILKLYSGRSYKKFALENVRRSSFNNSSSEYASGAAESNNNSSERNKQLEDNGNENKNNNFQGSYTKQPAVATSSTIDSDSEWDIYPLTTLRDSSNNIKATTTGEAAQSWPSAAARESLYSDIPVDRCDGIYLPIHGKLPTWLKGSLYRNGPGHFQGAHAVFDGCAMIARFKIDGGGSELSGPSVVVSHRFIETTYLAAARAAGGDVRWTLGHKSGVRRTALERLKYMASLGAGALTHGVHLGDNALISIFPGSATTASGKKELIAHTETLSGTYRIDPDTLETLGRVQEKEKDGVSGGGSGGGEIEIEEEKGSGVTGLGKTAHPHVLPNGDVINLACDFMPVASKAAGARLFVGFITDFHFYFGILSAAFHLLFYTTKQPHYQY
jgi:Retinal pigment epithelial membrane protein